ncbi:MAG: cyclodeaminase/cyclohydrolase family protein [Clostridiales bacterium]|nr:cyclodeaminase/cyclohydrolase family protein [Clostridiales bacterium]
MIQNSCAGFAEALASKAPVPGGGGASALVGALGAALGGMVANLTSGKKKYADVQADMESLLADATALRAELLSLVGRDAEAFAPLAEAYGLPKDTPERAAQRETVMETALRGACAPPLAIMDAAARAVELHEALAQKGAAIAISDAGVGVCFARAALEGASLNVFINTKLMRDRAYAEKINQKAEILLERYLPRADAVFRVVRGRLSP